MVTVGVVVFVELDVVGFINDELGLGGFTLSPLPFVTVPVLVEVKGVLLSNDPLVDLMLGTRTKPILFDILLPVEDFNGDTRFTVFVEVALFNELLELTIEFLEFDLCTEGFLEEEFDVEESRLKLDVRRGNVAVLCNGEVGDVLVDAVLSNLLNFCTKF